MSFNQYKKRSNKFNNLVKLLFFNNTVRERKLMSGKARGIKMQIDISTNFQLLIGIYEREIQGLFTRWAKQCNYLFDIGAADGYYGLFYKKYKPGGMVYLFDSDPAIRKVQHEHFSCNGIYEGYELNTKRVSLAEDTNTVMLNSYLLNGQNILIKIDVEGAELEVLHGADRLLENNHCYLLIETHSLQLEQDAISFLHRLGYHARIIKNAWWRFFLPERRPLPHNRWLAARRKEA